MVLILSKSRHNLISATIQRQILLKKNSFYGKYAAILVYLNWAVLEVIAMLNFYTNYITSFSSRNQIKQSRHIIFHIAMMVCFLLTCIIFRSVEQPTKLLTSSLIFRRRSVMLGIHIFIEFVVYLSCNWYGLTWENPRLTLASVYDNLGGNPRIFRYTFNLSLG